MEGQLILSDEKALHGHDLNSVMSNFKRSKNEPMPPNLARFKKKEPLGNMAKSILKHRIQNLTGQNMGDIEAQAGYSIKGGKVMSVEEVRRLAHLMILEAEGKLPQIQGDILTNKKRSRMASANEEEEEEENGVPDVSTPAKKLRTSTRKSNMMPEPPSTRNVLSNKRRSVAGSMMSYVDSPLPGSSSVGKASNKRKSLAVGTIMNKVACRLVPEEKVIENIVEEEPSDQELAQGLDNPTPHMLAQKRKSLARKSVTPAKVAVPAQNNRPKATPKRNLLAKPIRKGFTGASFVTAAQQEMHSEIFLVNTNVEEDKDKLELTAIREQVPQFPGSNLAVIHTPAHWQPQNLFNIIQSVRKLNRKAGLKSFLVLAGCGLTNVHMFREAFLKGTSHVQFLVFDRLDQNKDLGPDGKLRETCSYFLLGYFFPGCEKEDSLLPSQMVRDDTHGNCFQAESTEDLENSIINSFSETGDWILDICCKKRELTLAAQKAGRYGLAFEEDMEHLKALGVKARAIAIHHANSGEFTKNDGVILKL